ncbi:hypothetical protein FSB84_08295 [Pseudobacter ginsenosidimutans]|nr:hypothetical protein FSB84_08295 [Pseudobacter ginsenosidimutans]
MRRARKEGRWMASAPIGYINKSTEDGRKFITPKEPAASIIRWAFEEIAKGQFVADQIRKEATKKGLKCSRSNFWNAIRSPVYCGKILIPKFKEEEPLIVEGQHEPIISESLFDEVRDMISGRKRNKRTAAARKEEQTYTTITTVLPNAEPGTRLLKQMSYL